MENLVWLFDAAAGLLLIGFIVQGVKKGFSGIFIPFIVNLFLVALAFFMSGVLSETVYESTVESSVEMAVDEAVEKFDLIGCIGDRYTELTLIGDVSEKELNAVLASEKDMDSKLWKLIDRTSGVGDNVTESACFEALNAIIKEQLQDAVSEKLPPCTGKFFEHLDGGNEQETYLILNKIYTDRKDASKYIADTCIHDVMFGFVKMMIFVVSSALLLILSGIIFGIAFRNRETGSNGAGDSAAGVLVEIINGIMITAVIAVGVKIAVYSGIQFDNIMDDKTLNSSYVFKYLYNLDKYMPGSRM